VPSQRANSLRTKLAELDLSEKEIARAVSWARQPKRHAKSNETRALLPSLTQPDPDLVVFATQDFPSP